MTSICIFGDSITLGVNDPEKGGWADQLKFYLRKKNFIATYNLGISGDNSDDLLERLEAECVAREPNLILIAIGTNDSQYVHSKNNPRISLAKFQENLAALMKKAKRFTEKVVFVGLTKVDESKTMPVPWNLIAYYDNENIKAYNSAIETFCKKNKIFFIPLIENLKKEELDDGLHPNNQGHAKMFKKVKSFLEEHKLI
ncbi:hypothetical protein HY494_02145 [Candidatus Woesearchaeota archaeon]|nr:hypothetical protein [Candidatus Woesearchaeota archaeon]